MYLKRVLMGPGPSDVEHRVLEAMARPTIGHLDPDFIEILNDIHVYLQYVFKTKNSLTLAISGTGSAGMETCVANLIEPGDTILVCINGVFGMRMADVARRCGANVLTIETEWGKIFKPEQVLHVLQQKKVKVVGLVHAETSTGARQPIEEISKIVHEHDALLLVDAVTSLSGIELDVDGWQIDACYSGTQKCLSCPPGLSPVTFSENAVKTLDKRKAKVLSWYLDLTLIRQYWGTERLYHHTAPINMNYALLESLKIVKEEGLQARWKRHQDNHEILKSALTAIGVNYVTDPEHTLPMLNVVSIPAGVDDLIVRKKLLNDFGIEIGGGLGQFLGKVWRIGLMGAASTQSNILLFSAALEQCLLSQNYHFDLGSSIAAANKKSIQLNAG